MQQRNKEFNEMIGSMFSNAFIVFIMLLLLALTIYTSWMAGDGF